MIRIEICTNGYQSVINAQENGAHCAELCESLEVGGVTPSYGTLKKVAADMKIPVRVLIRPRSGNYIYNEAELEMMCLDIQLVKQLGYEGVVIGALNKNGDLDVEKIKIMMKAGEGMKFTFHRAIDACNNPLEALATLVELGFDKVLTSGCKPKAIDGVGMIRQMQEKYGDIIKIMAGGGININNVVTIINETGISNCHASLTVDVDNYNQLLYPEKIDNTGAAMCWKVSSPQNINEMLNLIKNV
ncbi:MAG: copper homeostasis protein CutC [Lentimicrobiaceae bacterium]|nr:copper homeostasis protein CutC [Lentimicrobiaceae bacterium]